MPRVVTSEGSDPRHLPFSMPAPPPPRTPTAGLSTLTPERRRPLARLPPRRPAAQNRGRRRAGQRGAGPAPADGGIPRRGRVRRQPPPRSAGGQHPGRCPALATRGPPPGPAFALPGPGGPRALHGLARRRAVRGRSTAAGRRPPPRRSPDGRHGRRTAQCQRGVRADVAQSGCEVPRPAAQDLRPPGCGYALHPCHTCHGPLGGTHDAEHELDERAGPDRLECPPCDRRRRTDKRWPLSLDLPTARALRRAEKHGPPEDDPWWVVRLLHAERWPKQARSTGETPCSITQIPHGRSVPDRN